jgi:hypothetical protein
MLLILSFIRGSCICYCLQPKLFKLLRVNDCTIVSANIETISKKKERGKGFCIQDEDLEEN